MGMSDMLKDPISHKLPFIGFMPEDFPFEIDISAKEKNDTP